MSERQRVVRRKATPDVWFEIGLADEEPFIEALKAAPEVETFDLYFDEGDEAHSPSSLFYVWLTDTATADGKAKGRLFSVLKAAAADIAVERQHASITA